MMKINRDIITKYSLLFSYGLVLLSVIFSQVKGFDGFSFYLGILRDLMLLIAVAFSLTRFSAKTFFLGLLIAGCFLVTEYYAPQLHVIVFLLTFALAARRIATREIIKADLLIKITLLSVLVIMYFTGLTNSVPQADYRYNTYRYSFGLSHPNTLGAFTVSLLVDVVYLLKDKKRLVKCIVALLLFAVNFLFTKSRSAELCIVATVLLDYLPLEKLKDRKYLKIIIMLSYWIMFALSLFITIHSSEFSSLNEMMTGRISLMGAFYRYYGVSLFGSEFINYNTTANSTSVSFTLDNAYMQLLVHFGLVSVFVFGYLYSSAMKHDIEAGNSKRLAGLIVFILFGLMENGLFLIQYNPLLLTMLNKGGGKNE